MEEEKVLGTLQDSLKQLPGMIKAKQLENYEEIKWIKKNEKLLGFEKLNIMKLILKENEVCKEKGEKLPYSNSEKREIELTNRFEAKYNDMLKSIEEHRELFDKAKIELEFLVRTFGATIALVNLGVN